MRVVLSLLIGLGLGLLIPQWHAPADAAPPLFPDEDVRQWSGVQFVDELPRVQYNGIWRDNPTTIAQFGLIAATGGRTDEMLRAADWLVARQGDDGAWRYDFDLELPSIGATLQPGWASCIAQGNGISLLVAAYRATGDARYLDAARRAVAPLMAPVADGGLRRDLDGMLWFEEYPDPAAPNYVLNGFLFTAVALYDLADATGDAAIRALADETAATGAAVLHRYALPRHNIRYALTAPPRGQSDRYHNIHVRLCRVLYERSGHAAYAAWGTWWAQR